MQVYLEADCDLALIRARRVAVIGYGNQGRAQALNLRDSGVSVIIGLPEGSGTRARAAGDGFDVMTAARARLFDSSGRPIATGTPLSRRFSAWARPWLP